MLKSTLFYFCCIIIALTACNKDRDETPPIVTLETPSSPISINVRDGFRVSGSASDNEQLDYLTIQLISYTSNRIISPTKTYSPNSNSFSFDYFFDIRDSLIESGRYYVKVEVSDGNTRIAASQDIQIQGLPKVRLSAIVALKNGSSTSISSLDENLDSEILWSEASLCKDILINSYDQQLWFVPSNSNVLSCYKLKDNSLIFQDNIDVLGLNEPFLDASISNRIFYLSTRLGELRRFNNNFSNSVFFRSVSNRVFDKIISNEDELLLSQSQFDLNLFPKQLISLFPSTGGTQSNINISKNIIALSNSNQSPNTIILSDNSGFQTYFYTPSSGSNNRIHSNSIVGFKDAIAVNDFEFILIADNLIAKYNSQTNFYQTVKSNLINATAAFDEVNNQIWIGTGNQIQLYDYNSLALVRSKSLGLSIEKIAIRYNR